MVRKGIILLTVLVLELMLFCTIQTQFVTAQSYSLIHIRSDGSVDPATAPIQHLGDFYKITANIYNASLMVEKNNIILDGQGFIFQGSAICVGQAAINLTCTNVTVTNFHITGWPVGVLGVFDGNKIVSNNFINNGYDVAI